MFLDALLMGMKSGREPQKKSLPAGMPDSSLLRLLLLGFFLKLTIAPVGMWKSGAGWANRWAGVFLPVHGFVHALEPRSARQGRFPHIHGAHLKRRQGCRRKSRRRDAGSFYAGRGKNAAGASRTGGSLAQRAFCTVLN